jgi:hypothetical protein
MVVGDIGSQLLLYFRHCCSTLLQPSSAIFYNE